MEILRACDRRRQPWKNSGGYTQEIARFPAGDSFDAFSWRVSMAEITANGPFSSFPNITRTLQMLEGAVSLSINGETRFLAAGSAPIHFAGDKPAYATLRSRRAIDLNLMVRRGTCRSSFARCEAKDFLTISSKAKEALIVLLTAATLKAEKSAHALERYDAIRTGPIDIELYAERVDVVLIEFSAFD